jgi:hypothetical protein
MMTMTTPRLSLVAISALLVGACAGGSSGSPGVGQAGATLSPGTVATSGKTGGTLPDSGAFARIANLHSDEAGPHDLDVYGFGGNEIDSDEVLVGSAGYGTVTDCSTRGSSRARAEVERRVSRCTSRVSPNSSPG